MGQPCSQALFPLVEVYRRERLWTRFVALQVFVNVSRFSPCVIDLSCNKNIRVEESCCEKLSVGLLWATNFGFVSRFHQTHNLSRNKFARALENQPISAPHFFQPQQMFLLRVNQARWKTRNIDKNLQRNNVTRQVEGYCISHFAAFSNMAIGWVGRKFAHNLQTALKESLALFPVDELNWKRSTEQRLADEKNLVICKSVAGYRHSCQLFRTI